MLQTFRDSPSGHPNAPGRQFSAPSFSIPSEEAVDIPLQPEHKLSPQTSQSVPPPQPMQSSPSQHHPAATINLTLDDIMRLLRMTSDPYSSRPMTYHQPQQPRFTQMEFGRAGTMSRGHFTPPAPHPSDHRPSTLSPVQRGRCQLTIGVIACIRPCMYVNVCACVRVRACVRVCARACARACVRVCVCVGMHVFLYTCNIHH